MEPKYNQTVKYHCSRNCSYQQIHLVVIIFVTQHNLLRYIMIFLTFCTVWRSWWWCTNQPCVTVAGATECDPTLYLGGDRTCVRRIGPTRGKRSTNDPLESSVVDTWHAYPFSLYTVSLSLYTVSLTRYSLTGVEKRVEEVHIATVIRDGFSLGFLVFL